MQKDIISKFCGDDSKSGLSRIMTGTFKREFLTEYNWMGKRTNASTAEKKAFSRLKICAVIIGMFIQSSYGLWKSLKIDKLWEVFEKSKFTL